MEKTIIGKIVNTFGLRGELKVLPQDKNFELLKNIKSFFIEGFSNAFMCEKISYNGKFAKLKIFGYDDINIVLMFKNKTIYVNEQVEIPLKEDEYLTKDIIGSKVFQNNDVIAEIVDVENFGASDILVLNMNGKEVRVPFVNKYFKLVEPNQKKFVISELFFEGVV